MNKQDETDIMKEVESLLQNKIVSHCNAAYATGDKVSILICPYWNDDGQTFRMTLTCDTRGYKMDWSRYPIFIESYNSEIDYSIWMCFLNSRGQATIYSAKPGDYLFSASSTVVISEENGFHLNAASSKGEEKDDKTRSQVLTTRGGKNDEVVKSDDYMSSDGRINAKINQIANGKTIILFSTTDITLIGASIRIAAVNRSGTILQNETLIFKPEGDEQQRQTSSPRGRANQELRTQWEGKFNITEPFKIVLEIISKPE